MMDIKKIGIVGSGTMGGGIAQVAATSGFEVLLHDTAQEFLDRGLKTIDKSVSKLIEKGKISGEKGEILGRIKTTTSLDDFKEVDFVVEAVFEDFEVKKKVLVALDKILAPEVILTSNTSSISITRLAALTSRPAKFMGMHFMNPVPLMTLVELIKGIATTAETFAVVKELAEKMGKVPVEANDYPGFIADSDADDQRGRLRPDGGRRYGRGHRHGDEAGDEPSDGAAGPGRPHRQRRLPLHHGGPLRRLQGFEIPALPFTQKIC
jgi:3-hydroxybutyryl-CoA dehydrogenase